MKITNARKTCFFIFLILISVLYTSYRSISEFYWRDVQIFPDSQDYLFNATADLDLDFFCYLKPAGVALVYKILQCHEERIVTFQIILSMVCWLIFAFVITSLMKPDWLKLITFPFFLLLSLSQDITIWDNRILTESISISIMVLLIATAMMMLRSKSWILVVLFLFIGVFWAMVKETNSYLILLVAITFLSFGILMRGQNRFLAMGLIFGIVFLTNFGFSNLGERWKFPILNIIGQRILVDPEALGFFIEQGMPVTAQLMEMKYAFGYTRDFAFLNSPELRAFQNWFHINGKSTYMKYLLTNFGKTLINPLINLRTMMKVEQENNFFHFSHWINFIYLIYFVLIAYHVSLLLIIEKPSIIILNLFLLITVYPHLLLVWSGDAYEISRHAVSTRVQLSVGIWSAFFVALNEVQLHRKELFRINYWKGLTRIGSYMDNFPSILGRGMIAAGLLSIFFFGFYDFINAPGYFDFAFLLGKRQIFGISGAVLVAATGFLILFFMRRRNQDNLTSKLLTGSK